MRRLALLLPLLLAALAWLQWDELRQQRRQLGEQSREQLTLMASLLSQQAQSDLAERPAAVEATVGLMSAQPSVRRILLLDAEGRVLLANRRVWQGRLLSELEPGWSAEQLDLAASRQVPEWTEAAGDGRQRLLMPFVRPAADNMLRNQRNGLVLIELELAAADAALQRQAWQRLGWRVLGLAIVLLPLLLLFRRLSRPADAV